MIEPEPGRAPLSPKIVREVRELHARVTELEGDAMPLANRRARRERRDAHHAEADLLRVLGFDTYDEFEAATADIPTPEPEADLEAETPPRDDSMRNELDALRSRVGVVEEELAEARFTIKRLRDRSANDAEPEDFIDVLTAARAALAEATTEYRLLSEVLRRERSEVALARADAQSDAAHIIGEAEAVARQIIAAARDDAVHTLREAAVTLEGIRRIAEHTDAETPVAGPIRADAPNSASNVDNCG
jgi:hypothetical protein